MHVPASCSADNASVHTLMHRLIRPPRVDPARLEGDRRKCLSALSMAELPASIEPSLKERPPPRPPRCLLPAADRASHAAVREHSAALDAVRLKDEGQGVLQRELTRRWHQWAQTSGMCAPGSRRGSVTA